jgi:membrane protease YdiL (CAAX protease family)
MRPTDPSPGSLNRSGLGDGGVTPVGRFSDEAAVAGRTDGPNTPRHPGPALSDTYHIPEGIPNDPRWTFADHAGPIAAPRGQGLDPGTDAAGRSWDSAGQSWDSEGPSHPRSRLDRVNRVWPIPPVVGASFVAFLITSIIAAMIAIAAVKGPSALREASDTSVMAEVAGSPVGLSITVVLPQIALMLPAIIAALLSPLGLGRRLALGRGSWPVWLWVIAAMGAPIVGLISSTLITSLMGESDSLNDMAGIFKSLGGAGYAIPLAILVGLVPGICEEILFRGYMQTRLTRAWGPVVGIALSSIVFAIFHLDPVHSAAVLALGFYLGWIAWASGSTLPAMLAHFVNNFLSVLAVTLLPEAATEAPTLTEADLPAAHAAVVGLVFLTSLGCFLLTLRASKAYRPPVSIANPVAMATPVAGNQ